MVYYYHNAIDIINIIMIIVKEEDTLKGYYAKNSKSIDHFMCREGERLMTSISVSENLQTVGDTLSIKVSFNLSGITVGKQLAFLSFLTSEKNNIETKRLKLNTALSYDVPAAFERDYKFLSSKLPDRAALKHCFKIEEGRGGNFKWRDAKIVSAHVSLSLETPLLSNKNNAIEKQTLKLKESMIKRLLSLVNNRLESTHSISNTKNSNNVHTSLGM
jgi:transposase